jgi:pathogenesis-related protein 1
MISKIALAGWLALALAGCATQGPAPVSPAPKKPAPAATLPPAKPAPPATGQPSGKAATLEPKPDQVPARLGATKMTGKDVQAVLTHHNKVRAAVNVGPVKWSPALAGYAQKWADHLAGGACRMEHRSDSQYGENLFQGTAGHFTGLDAAKNWESEKKSYKGTLLTASMIKPVGHYTQMVWRDTRMLGCGEATCNKMLIVVCNYDPPGNYLGRKPY